MFEQNTQRMTIEPSPTEKLREDNLSGAHVPGAQNPESEEIKREVNPNTE